VGQGWRAEGGSQRQKPRVGLNFEDKKGSGVKDFRRMLRGRQIVLYEKSHHANAWLLSETHFTLLFFPL
jgi:hypothetical protein